MKFGCRKSRATSVEREKHGKLSKSTGLERGEERSKKKTSNVEAERKARTLGRNGRAAGKQGLFPPSLRLSLSLSLSLSRPMLVPLAAKQSVKARFLYYRQLIGFLKVKCTSRPRARDEGVGTGKRSEKVRVPGTTTGERA